MLDGASALGVFAVEVVGGAFEFDVNEGDADEFVVLVGPEFPEGGVGLLGAGFKPFGLESPEIAGFDVGGCLVAEASEQVEEVLFDLGFVLGVEGSGLDLLDPVEEDVVGGFAFPGEVFSDLARGFLQECG